jgi:hypothetical protein
LPLSSKKNCVFETKGRTNQCVAAELVAGRALNTRQAFRGNVGDAADPIWNTNYFSMGVPTSRFVAIGAPIRRPRDLERHAHLAADLYPCEI